MYRDYFVFNLSGLPSGTISSATLSIYNPGVSAGDPLNGYQSPKASETYQVGSVSTPISALTQGTGGVAAFNSLAAGTLWGTQLVSSNNNGAIVQVSLNSSFLTGASSQLGNGELAIGGFLVGDTGFTTQFREIIFGATGTAGSPIPQLSLVIVPEPSMAAMGVLIATLLVVRHAARARARPSR